MSDIYYKIKRRYEMTKASFCEDLRFSKSLAIYRIIDDLCWRLGLRSIASFFHFKKDEFILNYLTDKLEDIISKYKEVTYIGEYNNNAPIWICWWSGEENAPELVKQCVKSIYKNAGNHSVHMISKKNYKCYLNIPNYILEKAEKGEMKLAHLSDYIRVCLLEKYGGLWLDATLFLSKNISEEFFEYPIYTCKSNWVESRYISNFQWTTFCLGGWKKNIFYQFLKEAFELYWLQTDGAIDYLLFDYLIFLAQKHVGYINSELMKIPVNNLHRDDLQMAMNEALPAEMFDNIVRDDTILYKLSWRETYSMRTSEGNESVYQYFLKKDI